MTHLPDTGPLSRALVLGAVLSLLALDCTGKRVDPLAPSWDVNLTAPVTARSYTLSEIAEKDPDMLQAEPGSGRMLFRSVQSSDPVLVGDRLRLDPIEHSSHADLGPVALDPVQGSFPVTFPGLVTGAPQPPLSNVPVEPLELTSPVARELTFKAGTASLRLANNLPSDLTLEGPVNLRDSAGSIVATFVFSPSTIPSGGSRTAVTDLAEKTIAGRLRATDIRISSPGSTRPVTGTEHLVADMIATGLLVRRAVLTQIPPQFLADNDVVALPLHDSTRVREVRVAQGSLRIDVASRVDLDGIVYFVFDQIYRPNGSRYTDSAVVAALGTARKTIDLSGMIMRSPDVTLLNELTVTTSVNLYRGSGGRFVTISENDSIHVDVLSTTIAVDSVVGVIEPTVVAVNESVVLDWGDLTGKFTANMYLPGATLTFSPQTDVTFPVGMDLRFEAPLPSGAGTAVLPFPPGKWEMSGGDIEFASADVGTFLSQIASSLPNSLRLVGNVTLNPEYDTTRLGAVGRRSSFAGELDLEIPLSLRIRPGSVLDTAVVGDSTGDGSSDGWLDTETLNSVNHARITIDVENSLPLSFAIKLALMDGRRALLLDIPRAPGDSVRVGPAEVTAGVSSSTRRTTTTLELNGEEVRAFDPARFVRYLISVNTPGPDIVTFRGQDRLRLRVWGVFSYRVEP